MKRSEINNLIREAKAFFEQHSFLLPRWAYWGPSEWAEAGPEADEIRQNRLGWDLTDFGSGNFEEMGLILFTIRNGNPDKSISKKTYGEKILVVREGQITPMHYHWKKMEDIINRGGGNLLIQLYNSTKNESLADTPVKVSVDGIVQEVKAGGIICLQPGESITLVPGMYHKFWAEEGKGKVLVGEVSSVNDDNSDNRFYEALGRFPKIEEDDVPLHLLSWEYPAAN